MFGGYASDWTRRRYSEIEEKSELCTELATTVSKNTSAAPHKVARLSFARHASVVNSTGPSQPLFPWFSNSAKVSENRNESHPSFHKLIGDTPLTGLGPPMNENVSGIKPYISPDIEAILDGSTRKPLDFSNFKVFLEESKCLAVPSSPWLLWASVMVGFLLEFRGYAEMFSRLTPAEKTASPHPFDIICVINSGVLKIPSQPAFAHVRDGERQAQLDDFSQHQHNLFLEEETVDRLFERSTPNHHTWNNKAQGLMVDNPLTQRRVNWAPSVRSYHQGDQGSCAPPNPRPPRARASRSLSVSYSNVSSAISSVLPEGLDPDSQPLREIFDALILTYLAEPCDSQPAGGLLAQCDELKSELRTRALLEARYTNHPAVLGALVEEILQALNNHVVPIFVEQAPKNSKKKKGTKQTRTLIGAAILLGSIVIEVLFVISPSPLSYGMDKKLIPRRYRLALYPMLLLGTLLIFSDRFNLCCLFFWTSQSRCPECLSRRQKRENDLKLPSLTRDSITAESLKEYSLDKHTGPEIEKSLEVKKTAFLWILTSVVTSLITQLTFLLIPTLRLAGKNGSTG